MRYRLFCAEAVCPWVGGHWLVMIIWVIVTLFLLCEKYNNL